MKPAVSSSLSAILIGGEGRGEVVLISRDGVFVTKRDLLVALDVSENPSP